MENKTKGITAILFAAMMVLALLLAFPMIASADYIDDGTGPTGQYYQYATFSVVDGSGYLGGGDVDTYGNLIYVNRDGDHLDVYQVTLLDSDSDGVLEPDQHPNNIGPDGIPGTADDAVGPMEQRTLAHLTTYNVPHLEIATVGEIYAAADRVYFLGDDKEGDIYEYVFSTGITSVVVDSSVDVTGSHYGLSLLGYDDVNDKWYAGQEVQDPNRRRVYSWDGSNWVFEFDFHSLSGGHMDGLEVVTDPDTNIPYVYVSDMRSDYLGQWRYDSATASWVEENLFAYTGTAGNVEGMGFDALGHFWATTGFANAGTLYEIGGGELGGYVPPPPGGDCCVCPSPSSPAGTPCVCIQTGDRNTCVSPPNNGVWVGPNGCDIGSTTGCEGNTCDGSGNCEIPEFSTIAIPVASILGLLFFFNYRKRRREQ